MTQFLTQTPSLSEDTYAASGTWQRQINDKLSWTNAARIDHQNMQETGTLFAGSAYTDSNYAHDLDAFSANSGLVYKATDLDTLRATYGRGVQMPSLIESQFNQTLSLAPNYVYDIEGNPYLKPTITQNYELDYDRQLPAIFSTARFAAYYENLRDIFGFLNTTLPGRLIGSNEVVLEQSTNVGNSNGFGGEVELQGHLPNGFRWDASYSYARANDSDGVADTVGYGGSAPVNHFRLSGGYTTGPWELDSTGQIVTATHMYRATTIGETAQMQNPGYASLGARIGYRLDERFTLALSGTNITQDKTSESPYPSIERQGFVTLTGKF